MKEKEVKPIQGEKMIEIRLRFWTNSIAPSKGHILPKHMWSSGTARLIKNDSHGISVEKSELFNTQLEMGVAIETLLIKNKIKVHPGVTMDKYLSSKERTK